VPAVRLRGEDEAKVLPRDITPPLPVQSHHMDGKIIGYLIPFGTPFFSLPRLAERMI